MNVSSSSQASDTAPLRERLAGALPLDDALLAIERIVSRLARADRK